MNEISYIFPVIVLYRCKLSASNTYKSLLRNAAFKAFMVYDNSPQDFKQEEMPHKAVYIRDYSNCGISAAYNKAAHYAVENGYSRLLVLDQDTTFAPDTLDVYAQADSKIPLWAPAVVSTYGVPLSPACIDHLKMKAAKLESGLYSLHHYFPINSGMCVSLKEFFQAGGYDENVQLDFSDFQFLRRLRQQNDCFQLLPTQATQDFSNEKKELRCQKMRYGRFLKDARHCKISSRKERIQHKYSVFLHTLSLCLRFRSAVFMRMYLSHQTAANEARTR